MDQLELIQPALAKLFHVMRLTLAGVQSHGLALPEGF